MYFTVTINGIHYQNEVELQIALDYIKYRSKRAKKVKQPFQAALVSVETGEIVYETNE